MPIDPHGHRRPQPPRVDRTWSPGRPAAILTTLIVLTLVAAQPADAYVGPGAGFALLSSFFVLFTTLVAALASLLFWPFRMLWRRLRGGAPPRARIRRLVIVGLRRPGSRAHRSVHGGRAPAQLQGTQGDGRVSPAADDVPVGVAGRLVVVQHGHAAGPPQHLRFHRSRSAHVPARADRRRTSGRVTKYFRIGRYRIPRERPELRLLRKSQAVLDVLGEHRIWSTILRVPITFPPDRFYGAELSAMSVPDLLGTQGTFLLFTTRQSGERFTEGGIASRRGPQRRSDRDGGGRAGEPVRG